MDWQAGAVPPRAKAAFPSHMGSVGSNHLTTGDKSDKVSGSEQFLRHRRITEQIVKVKRGNPAMKRTIGISIRALLLLALLMTSAVAFAQDEATSGSETTPPFIGIRYWHHDEGLFVTGIIPNTPAAAVDLEAGDIVLAVDGESIRVETVRDVVWKHDIGTTVSLSIDRDGSQFAQDLTLVARPEDLFENPDYAMPLDLARSVCSSLNAMTICWSWAPCPILTWRPRASSFMTRSSR